MPFVPGAHWHGTVFGDHCGVIGQWPQWVTQWVGRGIDVEPARLLSHCVGQAVTGKADRHDRVVSKGKQRDIAAKGDQAAQGFQGQKRIKRALLNRVDALLIPGEVGEDMPTQRVCEHHQRGVGIDFCTQGIEAAT